MYGNKELARSEDSAGSRQTDPSRADQRLPGAPGLGYYVYLYVNPVNESVFYVGKGKNGRALAHLQTEETHQ